MAKRRRKSQGEASQESAETTTDQKKVELVEIRLRPEIMRLQENAKGQQKAVPLPWNHKVRYEGKEYKGGDVFECERTTAETLISEGQAQLATAKPTPFVPRHLQDREMHMTSGVVRRDDVLGKIPVYDPEKGNKGEWADEDDLEF